MSGMLFYNNIIPLSASQHKNTKIRQENDFSFAAHTHFIPVTAIEFSKASLEFPIVFIKHDDGGYSPILMVGLKEQQNLYVSEEGKWLANYLPEYVRRYPFIPSVKDGNADQLTICIDDSYSGFNVDDGELLFKEEGAPAPLMERVINMLQGFHTRTQLTNDFCDRLAATGILEEMNGDFRTKDGKNNIKVTALHVVGEKKLLSLDDKMVLDFFRKGEIAWIYSHLISLGNFPMMVDRFFSMNKE